MCFKLYSNSFGRVLQVDLGLKSVLSNLRRFKSNQSKIILYFQLKSLLNFGVLFTWKQVWIGNCCFCKLSNLRTMKFTKFCDFFKDHCLTTMQKIFALGKRGKTISGEQRFLFKNLAIYILLFLEMTWNPHFTKPRTIRNNIPKTYLHVNSYYLVYYIEMHNV